MKDALNLLKVNFRLLEKELKYQEKELQKIDGCFKLESLRRSFANNHIQENKLKNDIQQQQSQLDNLVISLKSKLVSKSLLNKELITQERESLLSELLLTQEKIIRLQFYLTSGNIFVLYNELHNIKEQLSKKLTVSDFNNLYRIQTELIKIQINLQRLQSGQQTQVQIQVSSK